VSSSEPSRQDLPCVSLQIETSLTKERTDEALAVVLALGLALTSAGDAMAETGGGIKPCIIEHQFEPGPIVNGHHRQPTLSEVEARTQQLRALSKASAGACLAAPRDRGTRMLKSPSAASADRVVEPDPPSS
jgi:hypothetical protein